VKSKKNTSWVPLLGLKIPAHVLVRDGAASLEAAGLEMFGIGTSVVSSHCLRPACPVLGEMVLKISYESFFSMVEGSLWFKSVLGSSSAPAFGPGFSTARLAVNVRAQDKDGMLESQRMRPPQGAVRAMYLILM
jgi:hypothetical protein